MWLCLHVCPSSWVLLLYLLTWASADLGTRRSTAQGDLGIQERAAERDLGAQEGVAEGDLRIQERAAEGDLGTHERAAERDLGAQEGVAEGDLRIQERAAEGDLGTQEGAAEGDLSTQEREAKRVLNTQEKEAERDLGTHERAVEGDLGTDERVAEGDLGTQEGAAEGDLGTHERVVEGDLGTQERAAEGDLGIHERVAEGDLGTHERAAEGDLGTQERGTERDLGIQERSAERYMGTQEREAKRDLGIQEGAAEGDLGTQEGAAKRDLGIQEKAAHAKLSTEERASTGGLRILALTQPVGNASQSHFYILTRLSEQLISHGHQVTMPIHVHMTSRSEQVEVVSYGSSLSSSAWYSNTQNYMTELVYGNITVQQISTMLTVSAAECDVMLGDVALHEQLKDRAFDVAIVDHIFICGFLYAERLKLPVIVLECASHHSSMADTPDPFPLAYVPVDMSGLTHRMTFLQRMQNAVSYYLFVLLSPTIIYPPFEGVQQKYGIGGVGRGVAEVVGMKRSDARLWVVNQCWALNFPRPLLPGVVPAGGLLTKPSKPLPQDLDALYRAAGDTGVILVTLGSYITLEGLPALEEALLTGLSWLPHTVLYLARHDVPHLPPNVKVRKHIPQNDLLGHAQTKAAVIHGGINGVYEAMYHAVPSLIIPTGFDAIDNAVRMRDKGMAYVISPYDITAERVHAAMLELLTNHSYKNRANQVSAIFRDQPQHPVEKAAFWVEHVMRHMTDADYLRPAGGVLYWWQLYMYDVTAAILLLTAGLLTIVVTFIKFTLRMCKSMFKSKVD